MRLPFLALLLLLCAGVRAQKVADPASLGFDAERLHRIDDLMQGFVDDGVIPNAQTLIMRRGRLVHRATFGYSDLAKKIPAQPGDIYRIASQTKALATACLMMEFEKGKFLLEDKVADYIPSFGKMRVIKEHGENPGEYTTEPAKSQITIRQLLSHSAGIAYGLPNGETDDQRVPFFFSTEEEILADVVDRIAKRPLLHHPGEGFTYGLGIDVAGRLLEIFSGESLREYLTKHLWQPLGMADSYFYLPTQKHDRLVKVYSRLEPGAYLTEHEDAAYRNYPISGAQTYFSAGAGSVGTIDDYARFCQMLLNGGEYDGQRYLAPATVRMMVKNQIGEAEVWERRDKFGLGFQLITPGSHYGDQASVGAYTWGGLFCSEYTIDPEEDLVMLVYTNVAPFPEYSEVVRKFRILVYAAMTE